MPSTPKASRSSSGHTNAVAESFNSTLEFELLSQIRFTGRQQARRTVAAFIDEYNLERRHTTTKIDGLSVSPVAYEQARARIGRHGQDAA